jgi:hypothetical protein
MIFLPVKLGLDFANHSALFPNPPNTLKRQDCHSETATQADPLDC